MLVVGGEGLVVALAEHGLQAVWSERDDPAAVVQGFHPTVGWKLLAEGAYALATGIPWVASNLDRTVPTDRGRAPGNGTLVDALRAASGREPRVAGKPEPALFDEAQRRLGGTNPLVVGDRIDTDIAGASRAGVASLLVLTGVTSLAEACAARGDERPTFVAPDLEGLLLPHPEVRPVPAGARCGDWQAVVRDGRLVLEGPRARGRVGRSRRWPPCGRWWPRAGRGRTTPTAPATGQNRATRSTWVPPSAGCAT